MWLKLYRVKQNIYVCVCVCVRERERERERTAYMGKEIANMELMT